MKKKFIIKDNSKIITIETDSDNFIPNHNVVWENWEVTFSTSSGVHAFNHPKFGRLDVISK